MAHDTFLAIGDVLRADASNTTILIDELKQFASLLVDNELIEKVKGSGAKVLREREAASQQKVRIEPPASGYLSILSRTKVGVWKRRFCVLDDGLFLNMYDKTDHQQIKGRIKLRQGVAVTGSQGQHQYLMELEASDGLVTTVAAESAEDRRAWVQARGRGDRV